MNYYKFEGVQIPESQWSAALAALLEVPDVSKCFPGFWRYKMSKTPEAEDLGALLSLCGLQVLPCNTRGLLLVDYVGVVDSYKGAPENIVDNTVGDILAALARFCTPGFLMQLWQPERFEAYYLRHGFQEWRLIEMMFDKDPDLCGDFEEDED